MTKPKGIETCDKCGRPIHPLMIRVDQAKYVKVKDENGNEVKKLLCALCVDEK